MSTNEIFNQMLSGYDITTEQQKRNAIFEVNQQVILAGLYNGGFFNEAAFYGGTCLRIFHGLQRFSEDMDFSLLAPNENFDFTHLSERALQFNQEELDKETFLQKLNERLATADINQVKADALPFVRNPKELDIWSNDYFLQLAKMIRFE